ncbi:MAG: DNA recombination protein RmuC, partial [Gemmatimonadaceae bacterium]|nr:DNA recombination protein RmuC [Gemmatimonadaceae bacterium]
MAVIITAILVLIGVALILLLVKWYARRAEDATAQRIAAANERQEQQLRDGLSALSGVALQQHESLHRVANEIAERLLTQQQAALATAADVLERQAATHGATVQATCDATTTQRVDALRADIQPLRDGVHQILNSVKQTHVGSAAQIAEVGAMLRQVIAEQTAHRGETRNVLGTLRSSQTRGAYGEMTLRRTLEHAALLEHVHFVPQASERDEQGAF